MSTIIAFGVQRSTFGGRVKRGGVWRLADCLTRGVRRFGVWSSGAF